MQTQGVRYPARRHTERIAGEGIGLVESAGVAGHHRVVVVGHSDEHPGGRSGHRCRSESGLFDSLPAGLQQHAVLRIHRNGLALVDTEEVRVETGHIIEEGAPLGHRSTGYA